MNLQASCEFKAGTHVGVWQTLNLRGRRLVRRGVNPKAFSRTSTNQLAFVSGGGAQHFADSLNGSGEGTGSCMLDLATAAARER